MRILTDENAAHIKQEVTTLAVCWRLERTDGVLVLGTEHDRDLLVVSGSLAGTYKANAGITGSTVKSSSDMSVDNMEVTGAMNRGGDVTLLDLSSEDIEGGLVDDAKITLFLINWFDAGSAPIIVQTGNIGEIKRTTEGEYTTELRSLSQRLTRSLLRTYGASCDAELGDTRCGLDILARTYPGTIVAVHSNRSFTVDVNPDTSASDFEDGYFEGGVLHFLTGNNATYDMEVKTCVLDITINELTTFLPMPQDVQVGDEFTIRPGCDKSPAMCKGRFGNLINFRGHGAWCPGISALGVFGGQTAPDRETASDLLTWPRPAS